MCTNNIFHVHSFKCSIFQVKLHNSAASSCPLQLVSFYKCNNNHTDLKIDYKYNSHSMSLPSPLLNVTVSANLSTGIRNMQSKPTALWYIFNILITLIQ